MTATQFGIKIDPMSESIDEEETMANNDANWPTQGLLTEIDVAQILNLKVSTLRRWRWAGKGPHFRKLGGAVRYDPADIEAFCEASRRTSTSDPGPDRATT